MSEHTVDEYGITSLGLLRVAGYFLKATRKLLPNVDGDLGKPIYNNIGLSLELGLKAFLRGKGLPVKKLIKYGHNLDNLYRRSIELGINELVQLTPIDAGRISRLNFHYQENLTRYPAVGLSIWPSPEELIDTADRIIQGIQEFCSTNRVMVYAAYNGKCYHRETCRFFQRWDTAVTLKSAKKGGYKACAVCTPPTADRGKVWKLLE